MRSWLNRRSVVLAALGLLALGCQSHKAGSLQAPDFKLKDLSGKTVQLSQFRGHPVLIDFWATWCAPCIFSIPSTEAFYEANKAKGLVVLGLNMNEDPSDVFPAVKKLKITYPVLFAGNSTVPQEYALEGLPLFVIVDGQGRVVQRYDGYSPEVGEDIEAQLTKLLKTSNS